MLTLYFSPGSSSMAAHIALYEVGAPFDAKPTPIYDKPDPAYLALNPEGKVPTLVIDGGRPLTEVAAILYYLARRHPEAGLWPEGDIEAEAQIISAVSSMKPSSMWKSRSVLKTLPLFSTATVS